MKRILLVILVLCAAVLVHAQTTQPYFHITLLGTGVPTLNVSNYVNSGRVNTATLIETGPNYSERLLFDCGQGAVTRLLQSGGKDPLNNPNIAVDKVFLSHLHSDHYIDLASLYNYGWLFRYDVPLRIWGPPSGPNGPYGTTYIAYLLRLVYDTDIRIRAYGFNLFTFPVSGETPAATELAEGPVYSNNGVTVTAFLVDHHPVAPAYGFRIDYAGHSVVFSGDTCYNTNLIRRSQGADVILHEIFGWNRSDGPEIYDYHTPPSDWARVMSATKPKLAVMTHIATPPGVTDADLAKQVKAAGYNGVVIAGTDLMTIDVTDVDVITKASPIIVTNPKNVPGGILPEMLRRRGITVTMLPD
jgi:ribonuclease Z